MIYWTVSLQAPRPDLEPTDLAVGFLIKSLEFNPTLWPKDCGAAMAKILAHIK
jgi:hypothetical protein